MAVMAVVMKYIYKGEKGRVERLAHRHQEFAQLAKRDSPDHGRAYVD